MRNGNASTELACIQAVYVLESVATSSNLMAHGVSHLNFMLLTIHQNGWNDNKMSSLQRRIKNLLQGNVKSLHL